MPLCHVVLLWALLSLFGTDVSARTLHLDASTSRVSASSYVGIIEDPSGVLAIDDVRQLADSRWASNSASSFNAPDDLNFGFSRSAFWIRLDLVAATVAEPWLLEIGFPTLDSVLVYGPLAGLPSPYQTGDLLPFSHRPVPHRHFVFPLALEPGQPATFYVRVASEGALTVPMGLWQSSAFATHSQSSYALLGIYCGILIALGGYNLLLYFALRDKAYLAYAAFVLAMLLGQMNLNGFASQYLWPDAPRWANAAVTSCFAAAGCLGAIFTRLFLRTSSAARAVDKLVLVFVAGFVLAAFAPLVLPYRLAALSVSVLGMAFSLVAVAAGWLCWRRKVAGARWFLLGWTILLVGVVAQLLRSFGVVPTNAFTSEVLQASSSLQVLLLSFALADRLLVADREKKLAQGEALDAKEKLVRSMSESERRLESRVVERTGDLALANRELERARAKLEQLAHYDQLTQLPNRLMLKERLDLAVTRALGQHSVFAVLWMDLDGFKAINDQHGHLLGDEVLRILSSRMLENCRPSDLIVRFGGDEFIAVLESCPTIAASGGAAQRLIDAVHREVCIEGKRLTLQVSIGIAMYPEHGADGQTLLERADRAMYAAKAVGGACWREASEEDALLRP
jgi:diguanylate cyclase (GGDEF)-like protein